ncbi:MAG: uracil-DNA glycosylase family protein [gamma proteobacterium symbiont of Bathyaustriella thionipta]|nr:uracil-DNA glycosylase family protein [gamma proteobacterium symbiont of Bathyaustriella thionipta]
MHKSAAQANLEALRRHQSLLKQCRLCPQMIGPVITGQPVYSPIMLFGQAPGDREGALGRPFAWTAGKTLFRWFESIGVDEATFRANAYMAAVCRCFPGKNPKGGDRVPDKTEINHCSQWLAAEVALLQPQLLIPVGKLAIAQLTPVSKLTEVIGRPLRLSWHAQEADVIALPHPSGASTWHRTEPGKTLLQEALQLIKAHPAWQQQFLILSSNVHRRPPQP